jgi:2-keto-4-pentenoate hydratase/2-oxohepta-3-ene-1,7-dioic acid hydratase in catechol pathway
MRFVRYQYKDDMVKYGWLHESLIGPLEGSLFGEFQRQEANLSLDQVRLYPPIIPGKIICVGRNYTAHAKERNVEVPEVPIIFLKPQSAIIAHGDPIILPPQSQRVEHEAELVVVVGKAGRWISPDDALNYVFGYTIGNDVTARDLQNRDGQWTRAKGFDTFCPIGPWIETVLDASDAMITCHVNGEMRQMGSTRDMVFNIKQLISFVSSIMTLSPGDLLFTGTPSGVGPLMPGDHVEVQIEGIGALSNPVEIESHSLS